MEKIGIMVLIFVGLLLSCQTIPTKRDLEQAKIEAELTINDAKRKTDEIIRDKDQQISVLTKTVSELEAKVDELENGAARLLSIATKQEDDLQHVNALATLNLLRNKHPDSSEWTQGGALLKAIIEKRVDEEVKSAQKAAQEKEKMEKLRIASATKKLSTKVDEISGVTWYQDKTSPVYVDITGLFLYFGKEGGKLPFLRLKIQYASTTSLKITQYIIKTVSKTYNIYVNDNFIHRGVNGDTNWEVYDVSDFAPGMDSSLSEMAKDIVGSGKVVIRFIGDYFHDDRELTVDEKNALQNVLDGFLALGGKK